MKESVANNISEGSSARDSNNRLVSDGRLHEASWYEHFISSSGPYFVVSDSTTTLPDNLVLSNMQPSVEHHTESLRLRNHTLFFFLSFLYCLCDSKFKRNVSCLCHIVKCVDVLLSSSLFMNAEQCFCVLHSFLSQPVLLILFPCTCSLNYLPRLLQLSHLIITLLQKPLRFVCSVKRKAVRNQYQK